MTFNAFLASVRASRGTWPIWASVASPICVGATRSGCISGYASCAARTLTDASFTFSAAPSISQPSPATKPDFSSGGIGKTPRPRHATKYRCQRNDCQGHASSNPSSLSFDNYSPHDSFFPQNDSLRIWLKMSDSDGWHRKTSLVLVPFAVFRGHLLAPCSARCYSASTGENAGLTLRLLTGFPGRPNRDKISVAFLWPHGFNSAVLHQQTLRQSASFAGTGLHSGNRVNMTFLPAPPNSGIRFRRTDLEGKPEIEARVENVSTTTRSTSLSK